MPVCVIIRMVLDILVHDVRFGARQLRLNPVFTLTAVLTLGIAIGAITTIFSLGNALLFRDPQGVAQPDRLIDIGATRSGGGFSATSYPNYLDISSRVTTLEGVYAHPRFPSAMTLQTTAGGAPERVFAMQASSNYFRLLGAAPSIGRLDLEDASSVVLSRQYWVRRFGKDPNVVGQTLRLNGATFRIAGVAADGFHGEGIRSPELWIPLRPNESRASAWLLLGGRLKTGMSVAQARAEIESVGHALDRDYPIENGHTGFTAAPLSPTPGETVPVAVFIAFLAGLVVIVLAIACANISGVLLARVAARRREIAIRQAIGAGRGRILFQLLIEAVLLFMPGIVAGLAFTPVLTAVLASQTPTLPFPIELSPAMSGHIIIYVIGLSLSAAVLSGMTAALQASKADVVSALKHVEAGLGRLWMRRAFVIAQVALSCLLVVVAGLFMRGLYQMTSSDPGYVPKGVELASIDLSLAGNPAPSAPVIARRLLDRLRTQTDIESATISAVLPGGFEGIGMGGLSVAGGAAESGPVWNLVEPGYFATLRMRLIEGRDFASEDQPGSQLVVIVGEGAARRFWPGQSAVGKYIEQEAFEPGGRLARKTLLVVGVAQDPKIGSLVDQTSGIYAYLPLQQQPLRGAPLLLVARSRNGGRAGAAIQSVVSEVLPALPVVSPQTAEDYAAIGLLPQRAVASLSGSLGVVGILLAAIGVYGVTAFVVTRRTREIGIRVALGARRRDVVRSILGQGLSMVAVGASIGLILAAGVGQVLAAVLFGIRAFDPLTFAASAALFAAMGLAACYVPVRRALRIAPAIALRE
jgi:putative ABC transport system permease protein